MGEVVDVRLNYPPSPSLHFATKENSYNSLLELSQRAIDFFLLLIIRVFLQTLTSALCWTSPAVRTRNAKTRNPVLRVFALKDTAVNRTLKSPANRSVRITDYPIVDRK